jgi:hypothetical protein
MCSKSAALQSVPRFCRDETQVRHPGRSRGNQSLSASASERPLVPDQLRKMFTIAKPSIEG